ncbi:MAG: thermonuclease family protein [Microbacterium sp.]
MRGRTPALLGVALAVIVASIGCTPQPATVDAGTASIASEPAIESAAFVSVIDGDTIETSAGRVRIIGIDTPERGECGDPQASDAIGRILVEGDPIVLELPAGENDQDRYGRLIRYVTTAAGVDIGLMQLQAGNAVARYDSSDGYPAHPRESDYHAAQLAELAADGSVIAVGCPHVAP